MNAFYKFLWKLGFTDITREELEESGKAHRENIEPSVAFASKPRRPVVSGIFGRLEDPEWLLTDPSTRDATLEMLEWARSASNKS